MVDDLGCARFEASHLIPKNLVGTGRDQPQIIAFEKKAVRITGTRQFVPTGLSEVAIELRQESGFG